MRLKNLDMIGRIAGTELRVIFYSPVAWLIWIVFAVQCGIAFCDVVWPAIKYQSLGHEGSALTNGIFAGGNGVFPVMLEYLYFYIPLLTMGLMSREFSSGSVKLLYSSPVTSGQIVLGKYLSVMVYCAVLLSVILLYVILGVLTIDHIDVGLIFSNFLGMYLLICAYAVIGLFMSCLTSYQVVAAIGTLAFLSFLNYVGGVGQDIPFIRDVTYWLALNGRAGSFIVGLVSTENVVYFLVVIVVFLLFSVWRVQAVRGRKSKKGVLVRVLGVIVGVVVVSYFSSRPVLTWYWDMTAIQSNTISKVSQDLLHQLDGELKITTYVNLLDGNYVSGLPSARKRDFERFRPYARFKRNLKLDYVYYYDHVEDKYLDELYPGLSDRERAEKICEARGLDLSMFLAPEEIRQQVDLSGEQNRFVRRIEWKGEKEVWLRVYKDMYIFPSEAEVAAALKSLLVKPLRLAFLTGHGERGIDNRRDESYTFFSNEITSRNSLINQGFEVTQLSLAGRTGIPETVDILVIADVREAIREDELRMIADYVDRGGNLMVLGEPGAQEWMNPVVSRLGVEFREGMLLQSRDGYPSSLVAAGITPEGTEKFPAYRGLRKYGFRFSMPRCAGLRWQDAGFEAVPVVWACDSNSWLADRVYPDDLPGVTGRPECSAGQGWPVVVALSREVNGKEQRILIAGDADCISSGELNRMREGIRTANFSFATESFRWLAQNEFPVSLPRPDSRDNYLHLTRKDMPWLKFGTMGVLPCLLAFAYGVVRYRRKRY